MIKPLIYRKLLPVEFTCFSTGYNYAQKDNTFWTSPVVKGAISETLTQNANIASRIEASFGIDDKTGRIVKREATQVWTRTYEPGWEIKPN